MVNIFSRELFSEFKSFKNRKVCYCAKLCRKDKGDKEKKFAVGYSVMGNKMLNLLLGKQLDNYFKMVAVES